MFGKRFTLNWNRRPPDESIHLNRERCWHFYHSHVSRELWLSSLLTYFNTRWLLLILYFLDDFTAYPFRPPHAQTLNTFRDWTGGERLRSRTTVCLPFYGFYPNFCLKSDTHTHTRNFRLRNSLKQRHFSQFWFSKSYRIIYCELKWRVETLVNLFTLCAW